MPTGDEHDPGHQLCALRIEAVRRLPEPHEDLLHGILGLAPRSQDLPCSLEHQRAEAGVQLLDRGFFVARDPLHQLEIDAFLLQARISTGGKHALPCLIPTRYQCFGGSPAELWILPRDHDRLPVRRCP